MEDEQKSGDKDYQKYESQPEKTKIAVESAHLLASIIFEYFKNNPCTCNDGDNVSKSILECMYIAGGACRDYMLNKPINDVDLKIDPNKICKVMLNHLDKYHKTLQQQQTDSYCVLWRLYLNKFGGNMHDTEHVANELNCIYIINAKYIVQEILYKSVKLCNKMAVKTVEGTQGTYYTMNIVKDYMHNGRNLNGAEFDIANFGYQKGVSLDKKEETEEKRKYTDHQMGGADIFEVEMPNFPAFFEFYLPDLSINSLLLPLSHFIPSSGARYKLWKTAFTPSHNCKNYDWSNDFEQKQLTSPNFEEIVQRQHPHVHWWRLIKFLVRYHDENWKLPEENKNIHQKYYPQWLNDADFWIKEENYQYFTQKQFKKGLAETYKEFESMLKIIDETFNCNKQIVNIINDNKQFQKYWMDEGLNKLSILYPNTIDESQQNKIKQLFQKYGYPVEKENIF